MTSSIDTSLIDSSKPEEGNPTTASVRSNVLYIKAALNSAKAEIETLQTDVSSLNSAMRYMGGWDASAGTFPSGAQKGYVYSVSVAGTVDGVAFDITDRINCIVNSASTTVYAGNWLKEDYTDRVLSVFGRTGDITATTDDIPETSNKKYMTAAEKSLLAGTSGTNTGDETSTTIKSKIGVLPIANGGTGVSAKAAWSAWTPTISGFTLGNGTMAGKYYEDPLSKTVFFSLDITCGTSTVLSGTLNIPYPISPQSRAAFSPVGNGHFRAGSGGTSYPLIVVYIDTAAMRVQYQTIVSSIVTATGVTSTAPATLANGYTISLTGFFEAA
jgi:hypothetical protein